MHEMSVAQSLLSMALQKAMEHDARKIIKVSVNLGKFAGVEPQLLFGAFDMIKQNTMADGAALSIQIQPFKIKCLPCDSTFEMEQMQMQCPVCHGVHTEVLSGQEIQIKDLEITM